MYKFIDNIHFLKYYKRKRGVNMPRCSNCGYESENESRFCPKCGKSIDQIIDNNNVKKGHPVLTIILLIFLWPIGLIVMWITGTFKKKVRIIVTVAFVALFIVAILLSQSKGGNNKVNSSVQKQDVAEITETTTESNVGIGNIGAISENLSLVVNGVKEADSISAANGYLSYKPNSGKYAIVNVTIKNTSKTSQKLLLSYFKLIDVEGASYVATVIPTADDKFITIDTINPNLDITGNLVFEVPDNMPVENFMLQYSDLNIFNGIKKFMLK